MKIKNDKLFIQVTCLICSVVLWVIVMVQTNPMLEKTFTNVPVTIKNLSSLENSNMVLMNPDKDNLTVNIKVRGYGEQLNKISKSDFSAYIDVLGFGEGTKNVKVEVTGPSGVEIEDPYPTQIACVVESVVSRVMDVSVQYEGNQANEYYRDNGVSNPTSVKITGPRSIVDSAQSAVATINVEGATDTVVKTVPVRIYNGTNTEIFMTVPTDNVQVSVPIYPTKYVDVKPNIKGTPLVGYEVVNVSVDPERVKIAARKDILDTIKELNMQELDITNIDHNVMSSKDIIKNEGVMLLDLNVSPVVNVVVEKIIKKDLTYKMNDIEFTNIKEGYSLNLGNNENVITATISGPVSVINEFSKDDLKLTVDLQGAVAGKNHVIVAKSTAKGINDISLSKDSIDIELIESGGVSAQ